MKIRTSFVSNSSSSSFVGFTTVEHHKKALAKLSKTDREFIEGLPFKVSKMFELDFVRLYEQDNEDSYYVQDVNAEDLLNDEDDMYSMGGGSQDYYDNLDQNIRQPWRRYVENIEEILDWSDCC